MSDADLQRLFDEVGAAARRLAEAFNAATRAAVEAAVARTVVVATGTKGPPAAPVEVQQLPLPTLPWQEPAAERLEEAQRARAAAADPGPTCPVCGKGCLRVRATGRTICLDDACPGSRVEGAPPPAARGGRAAVLALLQDGRRWTVEEIAVATGASKGAVRQTLGDLKLDGRVTSPADKAPGRGGRLYYEAAKWGSAPAPAVRSVSARPAPFPFEERPTAAVRPDEVAVCVDAVQECPGRWLTADGVFERIHEPDQWRGGAQARALLVARIEVVLTAAAAGDQLDRRVDDDGRPEYHAPGTVAPNEKTPLMQGRRKRGARGQGRAG